MKRLTMVRVPVSVGIITLATLAGYSRSAAPVLAAAQHKASMAPWMTLFDGRSLDNWKQLGNANWRIVADADAPSYVEATSGSGFLITPRSYGDFQMKLEFWTDAPANSGVFIRCSNADQVGADNAYEVNIFDQRPDPAYRTGGIVNVAKPLMKMDAAGRWNTYEITADGPRFHVRMNGVVIAEGSDAKFASGPIALQYGAGTVRFRNVQIRTF